MNEKRKVEWVLLGMPWRLRNSEEKGLIREEVHFT